MRQGLALEAGLHLPGAMTAAPALGPQAPVAPSSHEATEECLAQAFQSFTSVAASLERTYGDLQREVLRLRQEREERNQALAESLKETRRTRQHLQRIVSSLPCGVWVESDRGQILLANPESRRLLGMQPGPPRETTETVPAAIRQLLDRVPENGNELECANPFANGGFLAVGKSRLAAAEGEDSIFILRDITATRRLEQERETFRRQQALAELSAVVAHEVRNPLGSLELFAGLLADCGLGAEAQSYLTQIRAGLRNLSATVNNVLRFHNPSAPALAMVNLAQVLASSAEFLAPLAQQAGITIRVSHQLQGVSVPGDHCGLEQVLLNLAVNGFHAMAGSGVLTLSGFLAQPLEGPNGEACAVVEVADTGPGIAEPHLAEIFHPGFTTRPGSPGLGLAVCRTIVAQHGGSIRVSSGPDGCRFRLELPLAGVKR